jgi:3-oxoacyl-[acyl-carrier protein] reductase
MPLLKQLIWDCSAHDSGVLSAKNTRKEKGKTMAHTTNRKWVLVTGGTRGIGKGLVQGFSNAGYDVVFTYRNSDGQAQEIEQAVSSAGGSATAYRCDCTDETAVTAFSNAILAERGAPYALINNAGITRDALLMRMSSEDWNSVVNTNLNATFFITRAFIPSLIEKQDGLILQMSSASALIGNPGQTNYAATKAGLIGMTKSLAVELGRFNIRVNSIAPGYIETEMLDSIPESKVRNIRKTIPLRRMGTVEEVTSLAVYLASPTATYITGQTLVIDGGLTV